MEKQEGNEIIEEMSRALKEEAQKRKKQLLKRAVPEERTLNNALMSLTRQELDDISYNVGIATNKNMKKAELVEKLEESVLDFSRNWFTSIVNEQYQAFRHLAQKRGISEEFRDDEMRLDYFLSIGVLAAGNRDGKVAWYMPTEILDEFNKLDTAAFANAVQSNSEILRVTTGLLFYYGVMEYGKLFTKVKKYVDIEKDFTELDFKKVIFNGSCWEQHIMSDEELVWYRAVTEPKKTYAEQQQNALGYANISYSAVYDAGVENYIDATTSFKELAQFFMQKYEFDVIKAADVVGRIYSIWQNGGQMKDVVALLNSYDLLDKEEYSSEIVRLLTSYHSTMRLWTLKGHTPAEIKSGKTDDESDTSAKPTVRKGKNKVGRNDPCPCGSGKKYKKCCMAKDLGQA